MEAGDFAFQIENLKGEISLRQMDMKKISDQFKSLKAEMEKTKELKGVVSGDTDTAKSSTGSGS